MNVFLWHVHGSWTTALVQGDHRYLVPVLPDRGPDGRGRAETWDWPRSVVEVTPEEAGDADVDVVILQRPHELTELAEGWLGRRPGRDVPAIYLEHSTPQGPINEMRHPARDRDDLVLVHVAHFNDLFWDAGRTRTRVIEHGVIDPGYRYSGEIPRAVAVINEAPRRARVTGTDLLPRLRRHVPLDLFGLDAARVGGVDEVTQDALHGEMARRRVYVHPFRWTSVGLSLIEAMHLGMPLVVLATTEAPEVVPPEAGFVSTNVDALGTAARRLVDDPEEARMRGKAAREAALGRFGLERFLADWDALLEEVAG